MSDLCCGGEAVPHSAHSAHWGSSALMMDSRERVPGESVMQKGQLAVSSLPLHIGSQQLSLMKPSFPTKPALPDSHYVPLCTTRSKGLGMVPAEDLTDSTVIMSQVRELGSWYNPGSATVQLLCASVSTRVKWGW